MRVFSRSREQPVPEASAANSDIRGALAEFRRKYGTAGLFELLEQLAFDIRCGAWRQKQGEFPVNIGRLAKSHSDKSTHVDEITRMRGERILMQFALFAQKSTRTIDFAHPIIADYLAGKYVL